MSGCVTCSTSSAAAESCTLSKRAPIVRIYITRLSLSSLSIINRARARWANPYYNKNLPNNMCVFWVSVSTCKAFMSKFMSLDFNCTNVIGTFSEKFVPGNVGSSLIARFCEINTYTDETYSYSAHLLISWYNFSIKFIFIKAPENAKAMSISILIDVSKPFLGLVSILYWTSTLNLSPVVRLLERIIQLAPILVRRSSRDETSRLNLIEYSLTSRHIHGTKNRSKWT